MVMIYCRWSYWLWCVVDALLADLQTTTSTRKVNQIQPIVNNVSVDCQVPSSSDYWSDITDGNAAMSRPVQKYDGVSDAEGQVGAICVLLA